MHREDGLLVARLANSQDEYVALGRVGDETLSRHLNTLWQTFLLFFASFFGSDSPLSSRHVCREFSSNTTLSCKVFNSLWHVPH